MSTTRPLLGMRRVTELTLAEQPSSKPPVSAGRQQQNTPTVDEFAVLEEKQEELKCAKPRVEQVFRVTFTIIGLLDHTGQPYGSKTSRQIWLQLRGNTDDVSKAKVRPGSVSHAFYTQEPIAHYKYMTILSKLRISSHHYVPFSECFAVNGCRAGVSGWLISNTL